MANTNITPPPSGIGGPRGGIRQPAVKPRDLRGTLLRLWKLTKGSRKGLSWILLLSAMASASAILSPLVIGRAVNAVDDGSSIAAALFLRTLYMRLGCALFTAVLYGRHRSENDPSYPHNTILCNEKAASFIFRSKAARRTHEPIDK